MNDNTEKVVCPYCGSNHLTKLKMNLDPRHCDLELMPIQYITYKCLDCKKTFIYNQEKKTIV